MDTCLRLSRLIATLSLLFCLLPSKFVDSASCNSQCTPGFFQCQRSCLCIPNEKVCDGVYGDCWYKDISDERGIQCQNTQTSECASHPKYSSNDILPCQLLREDSDLNCGVTSPWWCDDSSECLHGEDESSNFCDCPSGFIRDFEQCKPDSPCTDKEFTCKGGGRQQCIDPILLCDGVNNCEAEASDEDPDLCYSEASQCGVSYTQCADSSGCYLNNQVCDRVVDCPSGSDENCQYFSKSQDAAAGLFPCSLDGTTAAQYWVPLSFNCDGVKQCLGGGEDEKDCTSANPGTSKCVRGSCHHKCTSMFSIGQSGRGFQCSCYEGYSLASDGYSCVWSGSSIPKLYILFSNGDLMSSVAHEFSGNLSDIKMLDLNISPDSFFASSISRDIIIYKTPTLSPGIGTRIVTYNLENSEIEEVLSEYGDSVDSLVYDEQNDLLIWSERLSQWSSTLKLSHKSSMQDRNYTLVNTIDSRILSLAIRHDKREIYFTRIYSDGAGVIEYISMDGSDRQTLIEELNWPSSLKIDLPTNMLYFLENNGSDLKQASLEGDGNMAYTVKAFNRDRTSQKFLSFELYNNQLMYAEKERSAVYVLQPVSNFQPSQGLRERLWLANKIIKKLPSNREVQGLWVVHASKNPDNINSPCKGPNNCKEDEVCLPRGQSFTCVCPDNTVRDSGHRNCKSLITPFVVYYSSMMKEVAVSDFRGSQSSRRTLKSMVTVSDIHHDDSYVYWVDNSYKKITRADASQLTIVEDVLLGLDNPKGLAVDPGSGTIFWTETSRQTIEVADKDGGHPSVLLVRPRSPKFITLDLLNGFIFWTEENSKSIWKADMDGSNVQEAGEVVKRDCLPNEINFDPVSSKVFFSCDDRSNVRFDDTTLLYELIVSHGLLSPVLEPGLSDWCFTLFKQSYVIGKYHVKSYDSLGRLDEVIDFSQQQVKSLDVFKQQNSHISDVCVGSRCSQRCLRISTSPFFSCACFFGYFIDPLNNKNCIEKKTSDLILISHETGMKMAYLDEDPLLPHSVPMPHEPVGEFDFDPSTNLLCYLKAEKTRIEPIKCINILTGELFSEFAVGEDVVSFAIDTVGRKIYYTEAKCRCIRVVELDSKDSTGSPRMKTLVSENIGENTYGILLDNDDGVMFWSHDYNNQPVLERIDMNGDPKSRKVLKSWPDINNNAFIQYLALDSVQNQIYYTMNRRIQVTGYTPEIGDRDVVDRYCTRGMTVRNSELYFGVENENYSSMSNVIRYNIPSYRGYPSTENAVDTLLRGLSLEASHIHAYSYSKTPHTENYCSMQNGHCDYMCLRNSGTFSCACPDGVEFVPGSQKMCETYPNSFLQLPTQRIFLPSNIIQGNFTFNDVESPRSVDFMFKTKTLFIGTRNNGIFSMDFNGQNVKRVIEPVLGLEDIAVDWMAETIYWLESDRISVANIDGSFSKQIDYNQVNSPYIRKLKQAHDIAVHPFLSYIFISDWETPARVFRIHMDGSDYKEIVPRKVTKPEGLTIDFALDRLIFLESTNQIIQSRNFEGEETIEMMKRPDTRPGLQSMTINGSTLFFSEVNQFREDKFYQVYACEMGSSWNNIYSSSCQVIISDKSNNMGYETSSMVMVSESRQLQQSPYFNISPCSHNAAECQYLCLSSPGAITCVCPDPDEDNSYDTCKERTINLSPPQIPSLPRTEGPDKQPGTDPETEKHGGGNTLQDFELKLVMIVLVIIAVVVIILMVAILLLIRRHMVAAPPVPTAHALYTNHDNIQAATLLFSTGNPHLRYPPHGGHLPPGVRTPGRPHAAFQPPGRPLNNQFPSRQNYYVEMPPAGQRQSITSANASLVRQANVWTPTPEKNTNVQNMGTMGFGSMGFNRPFVSPPPPYQPPTNSNSVEDLQQHSTDDSSSA